jgi:hypothetical protein
VFESVNPFNPAPGALPAAIVGREPELIAIREALRRIKGGSPPVPVLFTGQRGMGKTALLQELRRLAGSSTLAVPLEALRSQSLAASLREKFDTLLDGVGNLPAKTGRALERVLKDLPKISYELPHGAGSIALQGSGEEESHDRSLATMLQALRVAAGGAKRFMTITVDEIQDADLRSLEILVRFVHESAQGDEPVLLASAGLNDSHVVLEQLRTYVQRWASFELRLLTQAETIEALLAPILEADATIEEEALQRLAAESAGYPVFIQTYGSAAWERHRGRAITLGDVEASLPEARARCELAFYVRPLARMSPRETLFALALAELGPGAHPIGAVARSLGTDAPSISSIRTTLVRKSIIAVPMSGKVEFRIPFTDRYLRAHREEYESEDVSSYRRRLAADG